MSEKASFGERKKKDTHKRRNEAKTRTNVKWLNGKWDTSRQLAHRKSEQ